MNERLEAVYMEILKNGLKILKQIWFWIIVVLLFKLHKIHKLFKKEFVEQIELIEQLMWFQQHYFNDSLQLLIVLISLNTCSFPEIICNHYRQLIKPNTARQTKHVSRAFSRRFFLSLPKIHMLRNYTTATTSLLHGHTEICSSFQYCGQRPPRDLIQIRSRERRGPPKFGDSRI